MISILTILFVIVVFLIAFMSKSILYVNEHEASIQNELQVFDDNFKAINKLETKPNYTLSSNHLYE